MGLFLEIMTSNCWVAMSCCKNKYSAAIGQRAGMFVIVGFVHEACSETLIGALSFPYRKPGKKL